MPVFDSLDRPYIRSRTSNPNYTSFVHTLAGGGWERRGFLPAVRATYPNFAATVGAGGSRSDRVVFDLADRAYTPQGTLVSRREKGAVLHDPHEVAARMLRLATEGVVTAIDGSTVRIEADSVCVHGDSPGAVEMARAVRALFERSGVTVRSFVADGVPQ